MISPEPIFPDLIELEIIKLIKADSVLCDVLRHFSRGEPVTGGAIPKEAMPLTIIFIAGDTSERVETGTLQREYVGYIAVEVMGSADKLIFNDGVAEIESQSLARKIIRGIERVLRADGLESIELDTEVVIDIGFQVKQYSLTGRSNSLNNTGTIPFLIVTHTTIGCGG